MLKNRKSFDNRSENTKDKRKIGIKSSKIYGSDMKQDIAAYDIDRISVKRRIGLFGAITFIIGGIIGSGIFVSPKGALENSGSIGQCLVIWSVSGILSMIISLVYAELGVVLPKSGGDYSIIKSGIGEIPAFLVSWIQTILSFPGSRTVQALVFADYICAPIFTCGTPNKIRKSIAALALLLLAITNTVSVRLVTSLQGLFTVLKLGTLLVISIGGFVILFKDGTDNFNDSFNGTTNDISTVTLAIYSCMWAYSGYGYLNEITEELKDPPKNVPRALIVSLATITVIYVVTNVSYFSVLTKSEFLSTQAVAYAWAFKVLGPFAIIIPICVILSVYGASNGSFFTSVRVPFSAARAGHLPEVISFLNVNTNIPVASVILNTSISLILLIPSDVKKLINLVSFLSFLIQSLSTMSLLRIRYTRRYEENRADEFRSHLSIPIIALAICLFMFISPFISNPRIEFLYGLGIILSGLLMYIPFVHFGLKLPGCDMATLLSQLSLQISPTVREQDLQL